MRIRVKGRRIRIINPFKPKIITEIIETPYTMKSALQFISNTIGDKRDDIALAEGRISQIQTEVNTMKKSIDNIKYQITSGLEAI